jgi:hypothetical protein
MGSEDAMNDNELLDAYESLQTDYLNLADTLVSIEALISKTGDHPSFTLPPVSEFIRMLKEILAHE